MDRSFKRERKKEKHLKQTKNKVSCTRTSQNFQRKYANKNMQQNEHNKKQKYIGQKVGYETKH